jgi:hypothetical protein
MTEAEWLTSTDPQAMLAWIQTGGESSNRPRNPPTDRKLRLFACACCRQVWDSIKSTSARAVVEVAEKYADGLVKLSGMEAAERLWERRNAYGYEPTDVLIDICGRASRYIVEHNLARDREVASPIQAALLRDIFGNPFQPVTPAAKCSECHGKQGRFAKVNGGYDSEWIECSKCAGKGILTVAWFTPTVLAIATAIHEDRDFEDMPILADALQDAGCDNDGILSHCRDSGPHIRGCWVLDLILGKE